MERAVGTMAKKLCAHFDQPRTLMMEPGTGAAGGLSFGLRVACAEKNVIMCGVRVAHREPHLM